MIKMFAVMARCLRALAVEDAREHRHSEFGEGVGEVAAAPAARGLSDCNLQYQSTCLLRAEPLRTRWTGGTRTSPVPRTEWIQNGAQASTPSIPDSDTDGFNMQYGPATPGS